VTLQNGAKFGMLTLWYLLVCDPDVWWV